MTQRDDEKKAAEKKKKDGEMEKPPVCTNAPTAEHARADQDDEPVITSYSIHYTKLYESLRGTA